MAGVLYYRPGEYVPRGIAIPGYPGYRATASGVIIGLNGRQMAGQPLDGYLRVNVRDATGKRRHVMVHRLVALTILGPCPLFHQVNHINGDKTCNWISNLEYVLPSENIQHSLWVLGRQRAKGERNGNAVLSEGDVREMRRRHGDGETSVSVGRAFGIDQTHAWRICTGRSWKHVT